MRAGTLNKIIDIERYSETRNDFGEVIQDWETVLTTPASIEPMTGKEIFASAKVISELPHKITFRYQLPIKASDRVNYDGRVFNITSIINVKEQNRTIELIAIEQN